MDRVVGKLVAEVTHQIRIDIPWLALFFWVWWVGQFDELYLGVLLLLDLSQLQLVHFLFKVLYFSDFSISARTDVGPHLCNCRLEFSHVVFGLFEFLMAPNA